MMQLPRINKNPKEIQCIESMDIETDNILANLNLADIYLKNIT